MLNTETVGLPRFTDSNLCVVLWNRFWKAQLQSFWLQIQTHAGDFVRFFFFGTLPIFPAPCNDSCYYENQITRFDRLLRAQNRPFPSSVDTVRIACFQVKRTCLVRGCKEWTYRVGELAQWVKHEDLRSDPWDLCQAGHCGLSVSQCSYGEMEDGDRRIPRSLSEGQLDCSRP